MASHAPKKAILLALLTAAAIGEAGLAAAPLLIQAPRSASVAGVEGRVLGPGAPLAAAGVYAYQLPGTLQKVSTDSEGHFLFASLPAGLYKIIVHKAGFVPGVVLLTRATAEAHQFLQMELARDLGAAGAAIAPGAGKEPGAGKDFWSVRALIPADVLREIERAEGGVERVDLVSPRSTAQGLAVPTLAELSTTMQAITGVDEITGDGAMTGGRVGVEGQLGGLSVDLQGHFLQLTPGSSLGAGDAAPSGTGQVRDVRLGFGRGDDTRVQLSVGDNRLVTRGPGAGRPGLEIPVDLAQYRLSWSQTVGENGHSELTAQYVEENNFHRQAILDPAGIPESSRTWRLEGSYSTALGPGSNLQTGIRYRERQFDSVRSFAGEPAQSNLDLFGRGGVRLQPAVLLEYGLYSTLSDGSVSMTPRGGVVFQLGEAWQLSGAMTRRVFDDESRLGQDFLPTLYGEGDLCEEAGKACYEVRLTRGTEKDDNSLSLGAVQRTVGRTLRLYFSDDFFNRLESLSLVPGDELPEVHVEVKRRLSPQLLAKLDSRVASGGGGIFYAGDGRAYENRVRYVVTSLDTHYQKTSTGVLLALHHIEQQLDPLSGLDPQAPRSEVERLQLQLSQDLNFLLGLASDWAVQLNVELSRGDTGTTQTAQSPKNDEIRRRFLGGFSVKF